MSQILDPEGFWFDDKDDDYELDLEEYDDDDEDYVIDYEEDEEDD